MLHVALEFCLTVSTRCYNTTLRAIIPLPDLEAPPSNAAHLNAYREFPVGSTVMALYPDTSCFYRAEVIGARVSQSCFMLSRSLLVVYIFMFGSVSGQR